MTMRVTGVEVRAGRNWSATKVIDHAESRLWYKYIMGAVAVGHQGLVNDKELLLEER